MNFRSCVMVIGLCSLFLFVGNEGSIAMAQQDANGQGQPLMTPVSGPNETTDPMIANLHLKMYEVAATGNTSLCANDTSCLKNAKVIQSWLCAANACEGAGSSKEPITCFNGVFNKFSVQDQEQISASICPAIKSPSAETRQALLGHIPNATEDYLVESVANALAIKGSATSCENYIKDYVGEYGPQWNYNWYRALSGCRILAHERTRDQEEKDFSTWFGIAQGSGGSCSDISDLEMRKACNAPGAKSPIPVDFGG